MINIYLAGSIDGLTYREATEWRINIASRFIAAELDVKIFDPTAKYQDGSFKPDDILDLKNMSESEANNIFFSDINMLSEIDIMVAYIQGKSVGTGTVYEIGYAKAKGIPVIALIDDCNSLKYHPFIKNSVDQVIGLGGLFNNSVLSIYAIMHERTRQSIKDWNTSNKKNDRAEKISSLIAQIESAGHREELIKKLKNPETSDGYKILALCDECSLMGGSECVYDGDDEINCGTCDYRSFNNKTQDDCLLRELKRYFLNKAHGYKSIYF